MKPIFAKWLLPVSLAFSTFIADFGSKMWANAHLEHGHSQSFLPGLLRITLTRNRGAAFGIGRGQSWLMTLLACSIVLVIIYWIAKRESSDSPPNMLERCGVGTIIGGALGNLFDRLTRGEVTDFLDFSFMDFPVFNVADALIDIGAGLVVIGAFITTQKSESRPAGEQKDNERNN